jgi:hypothetical protein
LLDPLPPLLVVSGECRDCRVFSKQFVDERLGVGRRLTVH